MVIRSLDNVVFHFSYFYNLCPFQNITQKENTNRVSGFHGIVEIWSDWIIVNGTITGMLYSKGERCGMVDQQAKIRTCIYAYARNICQGLPYSTKF